jgi:transposase InsO family protein
MHKNTRLLPRMRRELYRRWVDGDTIADLARHYHISRATVYRVARKARLDIFTNLPSMNHRYRTIEYGIKKLNKVEKALAKKLARREHRLKRYEKSAPGEMVHFDTKKLPIMYGESIRTPREWLHVAIDDFSRFLVADILPDRTSYSSAIFLEETIHAMPFLIECVFSDNGPEYKGRPDHAFVMGLANHEIIQRFTKPRHPQTNGKAERVIKTIMMECFARSGRTFPSREHRRKFLYAFVNWYNQVRPHQSLSGVPPLHRLEAYLARVQSAKNGLTR